MKVVAGLSQRLSFSVGRRSTEGDGTKLCIREAVASDYDELCDLYDEGDALHGENLPWIFQKPKQAVRGRDPVLRLVADETVGFFVAQVGDRLAGLICVVVKESPEAPIFVRRRYAVIDSVVVKSKFRRTGVGWALMEKAHEWAVAEGVESIEMNVWEFNQGARGFYEELGYETVSRKMSKQLMQ